VLAGVSAFGGVDVGVASAGVGVDAPVADMDDEGWRRVFDVNLTGPMMMTRAALPLMLERGGGSVVLVSQHQLHGGGGPHRPPPTHRRPV